MNIQVADECNHLWISVLRFAYNNVLVETYDEIRLSVFINFGSVQTYLPVWRPLDNSSEGFLQFRSFGQQRCRCPPMLTPRPPLPALVCLISSFNVEVGPFNKLLVGENDTAVYKLFGALLYFPE